MTAAGTLFIGRANTQYPLNRGPYRVDAGAVERVPHVRDERQPAGGLASVVKLERL